MRSLPERHGEVVKLNSRLMAVLERQPELAVQICTYFAKYQKIPKKLSREIVEFCNGAELYHAVFGMVLRASLGRLSPEETDVLGRHCADRLLRPKSGSIPAQPSDKEALIAWALRTGRLSFNDFWTLVIDERDWWISKSALTDLQQEQFGMASYGALLNDCLRTSDPELARIAAGKLLENSAKLVEPSTNVETTAQQTLKAARIITTVGQPASRILEIIAYILKRQETRYDWKAFFDDKHEHAERMMIFPKCDRESSIDGFIVQLDSFCDLVLSRIYKMVKPNKRYPAYGSALKDPVLNSLLPNALASLKKLHETRLQSTIAHPRSLKTGESTRRLKHSDFYKIRKEISRAFDEIENSNEIRLVAYDRKAIEEDDLFIAQS